MMLFSIRPIVGGDDVEIHIGFGGGSGVGFCAEPKYRFHFFQTGRKFSFGK
jgi:hypothetical protein